MRILFVHQKMMSFVERDLRILRSRHDVRALRFTGRHGLAQNLMRDLWELWQGVGWADLTFCWFGKLHAFFAVIFSRIRDKPSIVVSGGDEVARVPEINYGLFTHPVKRLFPLCTFALTDRILSVSEANRRETIVNAKADPQKIRLIYHGFDANEFRPIPHIPREKMVLTVGRITPETLEKKGLRLFVRAAGFIPDTPFVIVGPQEDQAKEELRRMASPNVIFSGPLYGEELICMYNRAKVYAQLSYGESFGCAIAEAMLCGCVPVLTTGRAVKEVGGDIAFYADSRNPAGVAAVLRDALNADIGHLARQRVLTHFRLQDRQERLLRIIDEVGAERR